MSLLTRTPACRPATAQSFRATCQETAALIAAGVTPGVLAVWALLVLALLLSVLA